MTDPLPMRCWPGLVPYARRLALPGGGSLFYYDSEKGGPGSGGFEKPVLLLIHGLGDEADTWRHLIPLLAPDFRVLAPDLPGFGRSPEPGRISIRRHTRAVLALLEAAGVSPEQPAALAGNSLGALIAEEAAFSRPDLARGLVLIDGAFPAALRPGPAQFLACIPGAGSRAYRHYRQRPEAAWASLFPYYADINSLPPEDRDFLRERVMDRVKSPSQERAYFDSFRSLALIQLFGKDRLRRNFAAWLAGSNRKIRLIWGEKDRILPPAAAEPVRELCRMAGLPGSEGLVTMISGAGHLPHQEKPGETAGAVRAALRDTYAGQ